MALCLTAPNHNLNQCWVRFGGIDVRKISEVILKIFIFDSSLILVVSLEVKTAFPIGYFWQLLLSLEPLEALVPLMIKQPTWLPLYLLNLFLPNDSIWQHRSGSTLPYVMTCWQTAQSHYLNQCWLITKDVLYIHPRVISREVHIKLICNLYSETLSKSLPHLPRTNQLTHWGRVTHICVSKLASIVSDNGLSPGRCQAIIWTIAGILLIRSDDYA